MHEVPFQSDIKYATFEKIALEHYRSTLSARHVIFDLSRVEWAGTYPASLLASWMCSLLDSREVGIRLPPRHALTSQVQKTLVDSGMLELLHDRGVKLPYYSSPQDPESNRLMDFDSRNSADEISKRVAGGLPGALGQMQSNFVAKVLHAVLFELAENALNHGRGRFCHVQASIARSSGPASGRSLGVFRVFDKSIQYAEIVLGDLGPGINKLIARHVPRDYAPPFHTPMLAAERQIAYSLEFSSTSDPLSRQARLAAILQETSPISASSFATGLSTVRNIVRSRAGQMIIRTPDAVLCIDYAADRHNPTVRGRRDLGLKALARLPGTHYILRLPLGIAGVGDSSTPSAFRSGVAAGADIDVLRPFASGDANDEHSARLHKAVARLATRLAKPRVKAGVSVVVGPDDELPPRVAAAFIAMCQAVDSRMRTIVIHDPASADAMPLMEPSAVMGTTPVLVGNLVANEFVAVGDTDMTEVQWAQESTPGRFTLIDGIHSRAIELYMQSVAEDLRKKLAAPGVRHEPGPFLVPGKYYTSVFYEVSRALEMSGDLQRFAEWIAYQAGGPAPDAILVTGQHLASIGAKVGELYGGGRGATPLNLVYNSTRGPFSLLADVLPLSGKRILIITDVICRGDSIVEVLRVLSRVAVQHIVALVDARAGARSGQPEVMSADGRSVSYAVSALVHDPLTIYFDAPSSWGAGHSEVPEERCYVIDMATNAPTLYVRPHAVRLTLEQLILKAAPESGALHVKHVSFRGTHYSYFLHFPRLFASLRTPIWSWVGEQIEFLRKNRERDLFVSVYNPDNSLGWLERSVAERIPDANFRFVTTAELEAPPPIREGKCAGNHVLVVPAIASARTTHRIVEWASRQLPKEVMLLIVVSRIEPTSYAFLAGIDRYRGAQFHVARFADFPVSGMNGPSGRCAMCRETAELTRVMKLCAAYAGETVELADLVAQEIEEARERVLGEAEMTEAFAVNDTEPEMYKRAYLRALYESAEWDLANRREINRKLTAEVEWVDAFIAMLGAERRSPLFSREKMKRILYKAHAVVEARAYEMFGGTIPVTEFCGAIRGAVWIAPDQFAAQVPMLLGKYGNDASALSAICREMLLLDRWPIALRAIRESADALNEGGARIVRALVSTMDCASDRRRVLMASAMDTVGALWSKFARSCRFATGVERLAAADVGDARSRREMLLFLGNVRAEWDLEIALQVAALQEGPLVERGMHCAEALARDLSALRHRVSGLENVAARLGQGEELRESDALVLKNTAVIIAELLASLGEMLFGYYCSVTAVPAIDPSKLGSALGAMGTRYEAQFCDNLPWVFCPLAELNALCEEVVENWLRHSSDCVVPRTVGLEVCTDGASVVLTFWDTYSGDFDLNSGGGIRTIREVAERYGGSLSVMRDGPRDRKGLVVRLMAAWRT